jgi:hypothetical protein
VIKDLAIPVRDGQVTYKETFVSCVKRVMDHDLSDSDSEDEDDEDIGKRKRSWRRGGKRSSDESVKAEIDSRKGQVSRLCFALAVVCVSVFMR